MAPDLAPARRRSLIAAITAELEAGDVPEPRREALRLWSELAGRHPADAVAHPDEPVEPGEAARLLDAARRRAAGAPLAHVIGHVGFRRLTLRSDARALIPRPETEGLLDLLLPRVRRGRVADVGTGSGALALSLALEGEFDLVVAVDASPDALALAAENRDAAGLPVALVRGDLCRPLRAASLDALVANPPYLSRDEYAALDPSVRDWEPSEALVSGTDGLEATRRLLRQGLEVLRPGGWIALEVDCTRAARSAGLAAEFGWKEIATHADLFGRERYLLARRSPTS